MVFLSFTFSLSLPPSFSPSLGCLGTFIPFVRLLTFYAQIEHKNDFILCHADSTLSHFCHIQTINISAFLPFASNEDERGRGWHFMRFQCSHHRTKIQINGLVSDIEFNRSAAAVELEMLTERETREKREIKVNCFNWTSSSNNIIITTS